MKNTLNQPLTLRSTVVYLVALAALAALAWGGWTVYKTITGRPPSVAEVRESIWDFLEAKTGDNEFKPPVSPDAVSNAFDSVSFTNSKGKVKVISRLQRGKLGLPETSLTAYFRTNQNAATTYEQMFRLIGQQLSVAEHLLDDGDLAQQQTGLVMAGEASGYARNNAMNLWLAARICEGYLWPNLAAVEGTNKAAFTPEALLNICDIAFKEADETNNIIRNYEHLLKRTTRPERGDVIRYRLARVYEEAGREEKALAMLRQITTFKTDRVKQEIEAVEHRLKNKTQ
jgi:hypothetical protein